MPTHSKIKSGLYEDSHIHMNDDNGKVYINRGDKKVYIPSWEFPADECVLNYTKTHMFKTYYYCTLKAGGRRICDIRVSERKYNAIARDCFEFKRKYGKYGNYASDGKPDESQEINDIGGKIGAFLLGAAAAAAIISSSKMKKKGK